MIFNLSGHCIMVWAVVCGYTGPVHSYEDDERNVFVFPENCKTFSIFISNSA